MPASSQSAASGSISGSSGNNNNIVGKMIELDGDAIGFKFGPQFSYFVINLGREKRPANNIHVCIYIYISHILSYTRTRYTNGRAKREEDTLKVVVLTLWHKVSVRGEFMHLLLFN